MSGQVVLPDYQGERGDIEYVEDEVLRIIHVYVDCPDRSAWAFPRSAYGLPVGAQARDRPP